MNLSALLRWWPLAAVVALLVAATLAAAHSTPQLARIPPADAARPDPQSPRPTLEVDPSTAPAQEEAAASVELPGWLPVVVNAALLVLAAAVLLIVIWGLVGAAFRRRAPGPEERPSVPGPRTHEEEAAAVLAAVDAGLDDLSALDRDPRRAVIACWLRLERAAAAAGVPRRVGDTSTDLVTRLLTGEGRRALSADVLTGLAALYREARYATHPVDERTRGRARDALQRLRAELTARAGPPA